MTIIVILNDLHAKKKAYDGIVKSNPFERSYPEALRFFKFTKHSLSKLGN
jgi:hypothetical protein